MPKNSSPATSPPAPPVIERYQPKGTCLCGATNGKAYGSARHTAEDCDLAYLKRKTRPRRERLAKHARVVDLFAGAGGLSLGLVEAGRTVGVQVVHALAIDKDPAALGVYSKNLAPERLYAGDIRNFLPGELGKKVLPEEKELAKGVGEVSVLLAGPPCQGHSSLNNHTRHTDKRNQLYERVGRAAEVFKPESIISENVPSVVHGHDRALDRTMVRLEKLGYKVSAAVLNLADVGVPQTRKRHVLVASQREDIDLVRYWEAQKVETRRTVWWAIKDLKSIDSEDLLDTPAEHTELNIERLQYLIDEDLFDLPDDRRPKCHQGGEHSYSSMYGRLHPDRPAQTLTSGFGSPGQGRFGHPKLPRTLTPHEAARLQFLPDSFDFSTVKRRVALATMIGNAVPPKLGIVLGSLLFSSSPRI